MCVGPLAPKMPKMPAIPDAVSPIIASTDSAEATRAASAEARRKAHQRAEAALRPLLACGDRIRAVRGECGARPATYTFAGWGGAWIVTASGINTIIPASVSRINGNPVSFMET